MFQKLSFLRATYATAEWKDTKFVVGACRWMSDTQWAIDASTVLQWNIRVPRVTWSTHVMSAEAFERCDSAAVHAFPINLFLTMLGTRGLPRTYFSH